MKLVEALGKWRAHPTRKGVRYRVISPADVEREKEITKQKAASTRESRLSAARLAPLPDVSIPEVKRIASASGYPLPDVEDLVPSNYDQVSLGRRSPNFTLKLASGESVAGRRYDVMTSHTHKDMGISKEEWIETYGHDGPVEDLIHITLYRDPQNPKKLRITY